MVLVDGSGVPLGTTLHAASEAEVNAIRDTLLTIRVPRKGRGHPRTKPRRIIADKAYDCDAFRFAMLVRGISGGTNSSFEPNVTAMATWHHKQRDPNDFGDFLNWLDPGLGIHAATVNLDPNESVEFGLGAQLSLWDGYLFAGIGYDLSISDDRGYFFVGTSLLKLLGALSN